MTQCPPACLSVVRRRIQNTLHSIEGGHKRASFAFVEAIGWIDEELQAHKDEFTGVETRADKAYSRRLQKALSEAVTLRNRIANQ